MAGNNSIQILRANSNTIASSSETLLPGQLIYNTDKNYLSIGGGTEGSYDPVNKLPIVCRELVGYYNDAEGVSGNTATSYSIYGTGANNSRLVIQASEQVVLSNTYPNNNQSSSITLGPGFQYFSQNSIGMPDAWISEDSLEVQCAGINVNTGSNNIGITANDVNINCVTDDFIGSNLNVSASSVYINGKAQLYMHGEDYAYLTGEQIHINPNAELLINANYAQINTDTNNAQFVVFNGNINANAAYGVNLNAQQQINILSSYDMNISSDTLHIDASQLSIKSGDKGFNISSSGTCTAGNFVVQGNTAVTDATSFMVMNTIHAGICAANVQVCSVAMSSMGCMPGNGDIEINSAGELSLNAVGNIRVGSNSYYTYVHGNTRIDGSAIALNSSNTYFYTNGKLQCTVNNGGFYFNGPLYTDYSQQALGLNCVATINWVRTNVPRFRHTLWVYFGSGAGGQQVTFDLFETHDSPALDQETLIMGAYLTPVNSNSNTGFVPASGRIYDNGKYQNVIGFGLVNASTSYANFRFIVDGPVAENSGYTSIHMVTMCCARSAIQVRDFITSLF